MKDDTVLDRRHHRSYTQFESQVIAKKRSEITAMTTVLGELEMKVNCKLDLIRSRKDKLLANQVIMDGTAKRLAQKQQLLSVGEYLKSSAVLGSDQLGGLVVCADSIQADGRFRG